MLYRHANVSDLTKINALIRASKEHWGYTNEFMDKFMDMYGIHESYVQKNEIMLLEKDNDLLSLYSFKINNEGNRELDLFFVAPHKIQQGIGKSMWQQVLKYALNHGWRQFQLVADPNAEKFYERMGAKTVSTFESFPGRFVPVMKIEITNLMLNSLDVMCENSK